MGNNKSKQSQYEQQCLESLRRSMFTKSYRDLGDMFGVQRASCDGFIVDDDFRVVHYFGLFEPSRLIMPTGLSNCEDDIYNFEMLIANAEPQKSGTIFPDFTARTGGFIEHFQVTAASDTRKGAVDKQDAAMVQREIDKRVQHIEEEIESTYDGQIQCHGSSFYTPIVDMSHDKFVSSFKKHWKNHIDSLKLSSFISEYPRIFMVDACSNLLCMRETISPSLEIGDPKFYCGLFRYHSGYKGAYSLAHDVVLLKYLQGFLNDIDFVVFMGNRGVIEIIKLKSIKYMLPLLGCNYDIKSAIGKNYHSLQCITVPNSKES